MFFNFPFVSNAQISVSSTGSVKLAGDLNVIPYTGNTCSVYPDETNMAYCGTPSKQFYKVYGQFVYGSGVILTSDKRLKENFRSIDNALEKILNISGKKYDYILDNSDSLGDEKSKNERIKLKKDKLGFIAQEVKEILPEAVVYDEEIDRYFLDYNAIIPVIVEAIKEQEARIDALEKEIDSLKSAPKEKSATINNEINGQLASLNQNIPNPFTENTTIEMVVPTTVSAAVLYIYNMQGNQIKQITITERGKTSVTIEGRTLKAGMFLYTLIADGKEVDTKKMVLTK
jgi:hypothetical protein